MALALYRRYRPDTFEGVIGQDQVTVPLMRALDEGKLTHAYLFSGPRGCGKTSSARILARCVNCAKGPTSHPCGECESCKDLATGGPGSIDVVEIDAASHNGVDDARELRERAGFAPARDRYKIFILDEAHMVTPQGFNALLKIVEEPPEHVMFIFATTEPDKVIGTIRSRTHHYPFRLVPAEVMGPYLEKICADEHIKPEPGVLKLAMRAGGGSVRDTLSVLDQLMVGSVDGVITHEASVALLGFTPEALIGEAVDAVIDKSGERLYGVIQKVVVGGFDPRRFVEDLLARVRDLLVLTLAGDRAESVLSDTAEAEEMGDLHRQAAALGLGPLTAMADIINDTLGSMTGAISPRMRLELLAARLLAGAENGFAAQGTGVVGASGVTMPAGSVGVGRASSGAGQTSGSGFAGGSGNGGGSARGGFAGASRNAGTQGGFVGSSRNRHVDASSGDRAGSGAAGGSDAAARQGGFVGSDHASAAGTGDNGSAGNASGDTSSAVVAGSVSDGDVASGGMRAETTGASSPASSAIGTGKEGPAGTGVGTDVAASASGASGVPGREPGTPNAGEAAPQVPDNRTPDQKWDALVAALPADVRGYVTRDKVLRISLRPYKQAGRMRLWLKFDKPLSKYAFALAVAAEQVDGSNKVVDILRAEVRRVFGERTEIAPTPTTDDGQKTPAFSKLPAGEQQHIKAQLLQENLKAAAGLASIGESGSRSTGQETGREPSSEAGHAAGTASSDDDESHRAGAAGGLGASVPLSKPDVSAIGTGAAGGETSAAAAGSDGGASKTGVSTFMSVLDDDDPWASPTAVATSGAGGSGGPVTASGAAGEAHAAGVSGSRGTDETGSGHPHKHVAVPDLSDGIDPWAQPAASKPHAGKPEAAGGAPSSRPMQERRAVDDDPWNAAMPARSIGTANGTIGTDDDGRAERPVRDGNGVAADGRGYTEAVGDDPWNQPAGTNQPTGANRLVPAASGTDDADPWNHAASAASNPSTGHGLAPAARERDGAKAAAHTPSHAGTGAVLPQSVPNESADPWKDVPPPEEPDDPWNRGKPASRAQTGPGFGFGQPGGGNAPGGMNAPARDPWNVGATVPASAGPQVAADEDEYSMDDESVGTATAMDRDELRRLFDVKKVETFAADDPRNPRNIHPVPRHDDE